MARIHIGLSGYSYKAWQGKNRFYPSGIKPSDFLPYYSNHYNTVELDGVWYRLPALSSVVKWIEQTPDDFTFSVKAHRMITHMKRLRLEAVPFLHTMLEHLSPLAAKGKLGPILIQLPPNFTRDNDRLADFLPSLPTTFRWAIEFRHDSWSHASIEDLLCRFRIAWAAVDTDDRQAEHRDTADFVYARLRRSRYAGKDLEQWAEHFRKARTNGKDCYAYCKHEDEGSPWIWADQLLRLTESSPLPG